jgi:hypothetical protein
VENGVLKLAVLRVLRMMMMMVHEAGIKTNLDSLKQSGVSWAY